MRGLPPRARADPSLTAPPPCSAATASPAACPPTARPRSAAHPASAAPVAASSRAVASPSCPTPAVARIRPASRPCFTPRPPLRRARLQPSPPPATTLWCRPPPLSHAGPERDGRIPLARPGRTSYLPLSA
nr:proline-rich receptor-like protein kinase PERK2 [Aegilops tauschii subsp. strangulata]